MTNAAIFGFGLVVFSVLAFGLTFTLLEFRKMGDRDQNDSYPRAVPARRLPGGNPR